MTATERDAARYRFLRAQKKRPDPLHLKRYVRAVVADWGWKLLGKKRKDADQNSAFWSALDISGARMDKEIDAAMRRAKRAKK